MDKIVYLIGAGASCNSLPAVKNLPGRMRQLAVQIDGHQDLKFVSPDENRDLTKLRKQLVDDIQGIAAEAEKHASIDTYGKKLFLMHDGEVFKRFKAVLASYFILEQLYRKGNFDPRYDTFWASILGQTKVDFPKNVRIVSWNYDTQLELSYLPYTGTSSLNVSAQNLRITTKDCYRTHDAIDGFGVFKLNGSSNQKYIADILKKTSVIIDDHSNGLKRDSLTTVLNAYSDFLSEKPIFKPSLSFAWENNVHDVNGIAEITRKEIEDCSILVVIGYSFPFFNRVIDRHLLGNLKQLRKVYIQDPVPDRVLDSFSSICPISKGYEYKLISSHEQFFLPSEL